MRSSSIIQTFLSLLASFFPLLFLSGEDLTVSGIHFFYTTPPKNDGSARIMVLFGGRNWPGDKTVQTFQFDSLARKHNLILLSPSFQDRNYWDPEAWSGKVLKQAVAELKRIYCLKDQKLYLYGYSAGGQCAALFYAWMPNEVAAWGLHACGVYPLEIKSTNAPALLSCGENDAERLAISRIFLYRYRELGGNLVWKIYPGGHELNANALALARTWFDDLLSRKKIHSYGEDDSFRILPPSASDSIETEFRNPILSPEFQELWRQ